MSGERFDIVFYAPWAAGLVGAPGGGGATGGAEAQLVMLAHGMAERGLRTGLIVIGTPGELPSHTGGARVLVQKPRSRAGGALG